MLCHAVPQAPEAHEVLSVITKAARLLLQFAALSGNMWTYLLLFELTACSHQAFDVWRVSLEVVRTVQGFEVGHPCNSDHLRRFSGMQVEHQSVLARQARADGALLQLALRCARRRGILSALIVRGGTSGDCWANVCVFGARFCAGESPSGSPDPARQGARDLQWQLWPSASGRTSSAHGDWSSCSTSSGRKPRIALSQDGAALLQCLDCSKGTFPQVKQAAPCNNFPLRTMDKAWPSVHFEAPKVCESRTLMPTWSCLAGRQGARQRGDLLSNRALSLGSRARQERIHVLHIPLMAWTMPRRFLQHLLRFHLLHRQHLRPFLRACRKPPRQSVRVNSLKAPATVLDDLSLNWRLDPVKWCGSGWFLSLESLRNPAIGRTLPHFLGHVYSQEAASMLPVEVMKACLPTAATASRVLDLCAAPGSKATQLAAFTSLLVANEPQPERAKRLRANLIRCGATRCIVTELPGETVGGLAPVTFDGVLVDVPCSAEGNVGKDRAVLERWRQGKEASPSLLARQAALLESAWAALKPGGCLVYSTCTLNHYENEDQCKRLLCKKDARVVDLSFMGGAIHLEGSSSSPYLRVWPQAFNTGGFFVAAFRKLPAAQSYGPIDMPCLSHGFRLLDWREKLQVRRAMQSSVGFWPETAVFLEHASSIWMMPVEARHPKLRALLDTLTVPGLCLAHKVQTPGEAATYMPSAELRMLAGDRARSKMTLLQWASLEIRVCDTAETRNAHLSLLAAEGHIRQVEEGLASMAGARIQPNSGSYSALVSALVSSGREQQAIQVSSRQILRSSSMNKVLHGFALRGDCASIKEMMNAMRGRSVQPDVVSYNTLLKAVATSKRNISFAKTDALLEEMTSSMVHPNHVTYTSMMSLFARAGDPKSVQRLIDMASQRSVDLGVFAFNTMIQAHMQAHDWTRACDVVRRMRHLGWKPDIVTYTTLLKGQSEERASGILQDMQKDSIQPNSVTYASLITSFTRARHLGAAMNMAREVRNSDMSVKSAHVACAILHLCATAAEDESFCSEECISFAQKVFQRLQKPDLACHRALKSVLAAGIVKRQAALTTAA